MDVKKIYFAGDLFDHKDLAGNWLLAQQINRSAAGRYQVMLPQDHEENSARSTHIRDKDLELLFNCDVFVANFDGHDLDSGTVVEFCMAKMVDMPGVLLRTDFRSTGDGHSFADPWNLMCSGYPRTITRIIHGMKRYHELVRNQTPPDLCKYYEFLAQEVITALDEAVAQKSWLGDNPDTLKTQYRNVLAGCGGTVPERFPDNVLHNLLQDKIAKKIY